MQQHKNSRSVFKIKNKYYLSIEKINEILTKKRSICYNIKLYVLNLWEKTVRGQHKK